jgi:hypothetical protein
MTSERDVPVVAKATILLSLASSAPAARMFCGLWRSCFAVVGGWTPLWHRFAGPGSGMAPANTPAREAGNGP